MTTADALVILAQIAHEKRSAAALATHDQVAELHDQLVHQAEACEFAIHALTARQPKRPPSLSTGPRKCSDCGWESDGYGDARYWQSDTLCEDCAKERAKGAAR